MNKNLCFIDAESDGLYGTFLTVAAVVISPQGKELDRIYSGIAKENMQVKTPWVVQNVLPVLGEYTPCNTEAELLERTWQFWQKHADTAYAVADVISPVEARLFAACVQADPAARAFAAPFPLLDLSSMLYAKGIEPLADRLALASHTPDAPLHNALFDVELAISIYKQYIAPSLSQ